MKLRVLLFLAVGLLVAADDKKDDPAIKAEKEKLKGTWMAQSDECNGDKAPEEMLKKTKLTITDDKAILNEDVRDRVATYTIDPSKKPAVLDLTPTEGREKGKVIKAIYTLDGDTLKIAVAVGGPDRPTEFEAKRGLPVRLWVFKRGKP